MGAGTARATPRQGVYRRHEPEQAVLHGIVREHLETFLARAGDVGGDGYPRFVERELRRYLDCGILCNGFARLRCGQCGFERLVAFSCKGKLCPSCLARRSGDTAAWLVDRLLPEAGYRQWVLTFPWTLRFRLAADRALFGELLGVFLRTLFSWQRRRGRVLGIVDGQTGAVTFVQRFGGALNLNPHVHSILPDGLWVAEPASGGSAPAPLRFESLPAPTTAEVEELTQMIARRLSDRVAAAWEAEGSDYLDPDLAALCEAFFFSRNPPVSRRESPMLEGMEEAGQGSGLSGKPLCASVAGFSLHAAQSVPSWDREALERLLRYGLRAPFAQERLSLRPDGKVLYRLRRPWPNARGATHLLLDPLDFLRRLAALVSFPYSHQVRYHGVFANRSRMRSHLPPPPPREIPGMETETAAQLRLDSREAVEGEARGVGVTGSSHPRRRLPWAQLLRRVLHVDALCCPRCSTPVKRIPMVVLSFLTDPDVVGRILQHLGLPSSAPALAPARVGSWGLPSGQLPPPVPCVEVEGDAAGGAGRGDREGCSGSGCPPPTIRPPRPPP